MELSINSGNTSAYGIDATTGVLTPIAGSPFATGDSSGNRPFTIKIDPTGKFAYVSVGSGKILALAVDALTGALTPIAGSPFEAVTGIDILMVDPSGKFIYAASHISNQ